MGTARSESAVDGHCHNGTGGGRCGENIAVDFQQDGMAGQIERDDGEEGQDGGEPPEAFLAVKRGQKIDQNCHGGGEEPFPIFGDTEEQALRSIED